MEIQKLSQRFLFGDGKSRLLGVFGDPIAHSMSPKIHNLSLAHLDLNYRYLPFHVRPDELQAALHGFRALGGVGFNATIPHKEPLVAMMDRLDGAAEKIGAGNTVAIGDDGELVGYNTDAYGFITAMGEEHGKNLQEKKILILGAGGACRAVLVALLEAEACEITLANRTASRAEALAADFNDHYPQARIKPVPLDFAALPLEDSDILINSSSLGLHPEDDLPLDAGRLKTHSLIYDIVYSATGTKLQKIAQTHGLPFIGGLGMLIHQAARAFEIWTGHKMPVHLVQERIFNQGKQTG